MDKNSFVFYRSFYEAIKKLKKSDQLTLYSHICEYALGENVGEISGVPAAIFDLIKPQIDANLRRYENGLKGGRPKTEPKPNNNLTATKPKRNVNVNVNENVNVNDNVNVNVNSPDGDQTTKTESETQTTTGVWPTIGTIKTYCAEQGIETDVAKFYQYNLKRRFDRDWKDALTLWVGHDRQDPEPKKKPNSFNDNFPARKYDYDELEKRLLQVKGT